MDYLVNLDVELKEYSNEELVDYFHGIELAGTGARGRYQHQVVKEELLRRLKGYIPPTKKTKDYYCGECYRDFQKGEKVWLDVNGVDCVCSNCKENLIGTEWEPRKVER